MKVCVIVNDVPRKNSLSAIYSSGIIRAFEGLKGRCDLTLIAIHSSEKKAYHINGLKVVPLRYTKKFPLRTVSAVLACLLAVRREKPDLIHCRQADLAAFLGCACKAFFGLPYVVTCAGGDIAIDREIGYGSRLNWAGNLMAWIGLKHADKVLPLSVNLASICTGEFGIRESKIRLAANAIDCDFFKPKKKSNFLEGCPAILTVARMDRSKGIDTLLQSIKFVLKKHPKAKFHLVGDYVDIREQSEKRVLEKIIFEECLEKNLVRHGNVKNSEIPKYLNSADIFVLPSRIEGMPSALLEAMACGKPVIASRISAAGIVEDGKNGLVLQDQDPERLAELISGLFASRQLQKKLGKNARKTARNYSKEKIAEKMLKTYSEVLQ